VLFATSSWVVILSVVGAVFELAALFTVLGVFRRARAAVASAVSSLLSVPNPASAEPRIVEVKAASHGESGGTVRGIAKVFDEGQVITYRDLLELDDRIARALRDVRAEADQGVARVGEELNRASQQLHKEMTAFHRATERELATDRQRVNRAAILVLIGICCGAGANIVGSGAF
jgi:hypothetical protein